MENSIRLLLPVAGCATLAAIILAFANRQTDVATEPPPRPGSRLPAGFEAPVTKTVAPLTEGNFPTHRPDARLPRSPKVAGSSHPNSVTSSQASFPVPANKGGHGVPGRTAITAEQGSYLTPQPAAWIDLGDPELPNNGNFTEHVTTLAEEAVTRLAESGHTPGTPEYQALQAEVTADADFRMRQIYGGHVWMAHHIHSHHLAAGNLPPEP